MNTQPNRSAAITGAGSATSLNNMQTAGLPAKTAAIRIIDISEQIPAPTRATVGKDAEEIIQMVREKSDEELDILRMQLFGFDKI